MTKMIYLTNYYYEVNKTYEKRIAVNVDAITDIIDCGGSIVALNNGRTYNVRENIEKIVELIEDKKV